MTISRRARRDGPLRVLAALAAAGWVGCSTTMATIGLGGTSVTIRSLELGDVALGSTRDLVILDGEGRRSARAFVNQEMVRQARKAGYFTVEDRSGEGHRVHVVDREASLDGGRRRMPADQAGMRIDIYEWSTERELRPVTTQNAQGDRVTEHVPVRHGKVVLTVSLFDAKGVAHMAERDFEGRSEIKQGATRQAALEGAARDAVARVLAEVMPRVVTRQVRLDEQDPEQKATVALAGQGAIAQASDAAAGYFQTHPTSPSAAYNFAVLLDASGKHEQALALYDRAVGLGGQDFYHEARSGCTRRLAAKRALAGRPVPASLSGDYLR